MSVRERTAAWSRGGALLALAWALVVVVSWPAVTSFVAHDDDAWMAWGREPLSTLVTGSPYATFRPAFSLLMAAEVRLFGDWLPGYRLVALAAHLAATGLVWGIARRVLDDGRSLAAALVFLAAGVHHETLYWIAGRPDLFAGLLVLAALLGHTASVPRPIVVAAASLLAPLFKETGLIVVAVIAGAAVVRGTIRERRREIVRGILLTLPALAAFVLYVALSETTGRLGNAIRSIPGRAVWFVPGLASSVFPVPVEEADAWTAWRWGSASKAVGLLAAIAVVSLLLRYRRAFDAPARRLGLVLLAAGLAPFLLLDQQRLLYLAPAGAGILVASLERRRLALVLAAAIAIANAAVLRTYAVRWHTAGEIGRSTLTQLSNVPETRIALVDYPLDVGEVLGSAAALGRLPAGKDVQIVVPLRTSDASPRPSPIEIAGGRMTVSRPVRWNDHIVYPCDTARMRTNVVPVALGPCRADAPLHVSVALADLDGVAVYRWASAGLVREEIARAATSP